MEHTHFFNPTRSLGFLYAIQHREILMTVLDKSTLLINDH